MGPQAIRALQAAGIAGPGPLPNGVIAAWKEAGAEPGWVAVERYLNHPELRRIDRKARGEVPAFRCRKWTAGVVQSLQQP
jgi:hypothetical protein